MREEALSPAVVGFPQARDFSTALNDMCTIEENLEAKRRILSLRTDFNLQDAYKMFTQLNF
jgi:hypothetical protein